MYVKNVLCLFLSFWLFPVWTLTPPKAKANQQQHGDRRDFLQTTIAAAALTSSLLSPKAALAAAATEPVTSSSSSAAGGANAFVGTFSDPINHPGGTRTIKLLDNQSVGDYQLAQVIGGGGIGEPKSYVLPAVIISDRAIIIDFSPKGGPKDFTGVLDNKKNNGGDIKFLRDGNRWPRL